MQTQRKMIIDGSERVLVTGANGFIGSRVVETLLSHGFTNIRCFVRPSGNLSKLEKIIRAFPGATVDLLYGNLLSKEHCTRAVNNVAVILHVAAGIEKTFPGCFMNSVVTTRNLLDAAVTSNTVKRFLNVSSFAVYSNRNIRRRGLLDESCEMESEFMHRADAYCFGKTKQDEIVMEYGRERQLPYVIVRPGVVYGPGARGAIHSRIGIGTFGVFVHIGGGNRIPLSYIDNCAEAIVLAGITEGVDGQVFNAVDDDLPTSRTFLKQYKRSVKDFDSLYVPFRVFYLFSYLWERYSIWSKGQLPLAFNRFKTAAEWKGNVYSNEKLKRLVGWSPKVATAEGMRRHFEYFKTLEAKNA